MLDACVQPPGGISEARDIPREGGKPICSRLKHEVFDILDSELSWADVYAEGTHSKFHRPEMELLLMFDFCSILATMNPYVFLHRIKDAMQIKICNQEARTQKNLSFGYIFIRTKRSGPYIQNEHIIKKN